MTLETVDKILHADWVIPVEPANSVLSNHCVVVGGERIVDVLPSDVATAKYHAVESIELGGHALIPGLVNCHTHAAMSLFRGLADDLPLEQWLEQYIWPTEARVVDRQFVHDGSLLAAAEMLLSGTTCFNDMYFFPDEAANAAIEAGIRANIGMIVIGFPSAWASNTDEYFAKGQAVHDRFRAHPLVTTNFAPHAPYTVDDPSLARIATLAEELDVPINIHLHETQSEVDASLANEGRRPIDRLEQLGLLSHRLIAVHMTALTDQEIAKLATNGVSVVHCPESNLKLASGFCPVAKLLDAGVNLALGTDGAASNNDLDMLGEMRTAALLAKGVAGNASVAPAAAMLRAATYGGAKALGQEHNIGSIAAGKLADLVAIDLSGIGATPVFDPVSQIVYAGHRDQVSHVWVNGRHVVVDGELTSIDKNALTNAAMQWRAQILNRPAD